MNKEVKQLAKALERQGFVIGKLTANGYREVLTAGGEFVTMLPNTPSDHRWRANTIAAARRHGFRWPPPR